MYETLTAVVTKYFHYFRNKNLCRSWISMRFSLPLIVTTIFRFLLVTAIIAVSLRFFRKSPPKMNTAISKPSSPQPQSYLFDKRIVHLDLKGAPPRFSYLRELLPFIKSLGFNGILMEYEDMFPYYGMLEILKAENAYTETELQEILEIAGKNELEIIPLIQTFGHMEFVLKHAAFKSLREIPRKNDTICPSDPNSALLIQEMIKQIRTLHPDAKSIHIGCDEAWSIGKDARCRQELQTTFNGSVESLKLSHITTVAQYAKDNGFEKVLAWDDLFNRLPLDLLLHHRLGDFIIPVIWNYVEDVTEVDQFPPGMFHRYSQIFPSLMFGSVFKGALRARQTYVNLRKYLSNFKSYFSIMRQQKKYLNNRMSGIIVTGWQRFKHGGPLCELIPEGLPVLIEEAMFMRDPSLDDSRIHQKAMEHLKCAKSRLSPRNYNGMEYVPRIEASYADCHFPGKDVFVLIEKLHYLHWRALNGEDIPDPRLIIEQQILVQKFNETLNYYFYEDAVKEFIKQNVVSLIPDLPISSNPTVI